MEEKNCHEGARTQSFISQNNKMFLWNILLVEKIFFLYGSLGTFGITFRF